MAYPKGKPKSEESKRKASVSCRAAWTPEKRAQRAAEYAGSGNPFFGRTHSSETRERLSESHKGFVQSAEQRAKISASLIGNQRAKGNSYKLTLEQRARLSESKRGPLNYAWKGGITPEQKRIRGSFEYREWRTTVFARDDFACQECGARNGNGSNVYLEAHHVLPFSTHPDERFNPDNGVTLCAPCHRLTDTYGCVAMVAA